MPKELKRNLNKDIRIYIVSPVAPEGFCDNDFFICKIYYFFS